VLRLRLQAQTQLGTLPIYFHHPATLALNDLGMVRGVELLRDVEWKALVHLRQHQYRSGRHQQRSLSRLAPYRELRLQRSHGADLSLSGGELQLCQR